MKINDRLKKIGDLVDTNSLCLDIGCDHALLDVYLVKIRKFSKSIGSDIKEGPLSKAKENIKKYQVKDKVELRLGDGLESYTDDIDTAIVSGMGGRTIIGIFKNNFKITKKLTQIIVSPNNYQMDVRMFFTKNGFYLEDEELVKDGKYIYQIMKFKKGKKHYTKKDMFFGPILLTKKNKLFKDYYKRELTSRQIMIKLLPKNFYLKKLKTKKEIKLIEKELS